MSQSFNNSWLFTLGWRTGNYCIPMTSIIVMPYMWIIFSWLISRQSRISFQFHARKNRIPLIFFHGLVISEININKNKIKWFTWSCSVICRSLVFTKNTCVLTEICCFVSIYPSRSCLVFVPYNKTNIQRLFWFNIEIIHSRVSNFWY